MRTPRHDAVAEIWRASQETKARGPVVTQFSDALCVLRPFNIHFNPFKVDFAQMLYSSSYNFCGDDMETGFERKKRGMQGGRLDNAATQARDPLEGVRPIRRRVLTCP